MRLLALLTVLCLVAASSARAQVLLHDDFNSGQADGFATTQGAWKVIQPIGPAIPRPGVYHSRVEGGAGELSSSMAGNASWTDYRLQLDLMVQGNADHVVRFRVQDVMNYLQLDVRGDPFNDVSLDHVADDVPTSLVHLTGFVTHAGEWHHVEMNVSGNFITAKFDGQVVASAFDPQPYVSGGIQVVAFSGDGDSQDAFVDNVDVTAGQPVAVGPMSWGRLKAMY